MKELKTYISEGFFNNVGANNIIKPVIDTIKDASINNKIKSVDKNVKFRDLLISILNDIETSMKKGKIAFEYIRNIGDKNAKTTITLEMNEPNDVRWTYSNKNGTYDNSTYAIASNISSDLYYETKYSSKNPNLRHSIANTIKVTEFKVS